VSRHRRLIVAHWSVHELCATKHLCPVFLAPPLWMCEVET